MGRGGETEDNRTALLKFEDTADKGEYEGGQWRWKKNWMVTIKIMRWWFRIDSGKGKSPAGYVSVKNGDWRDGA